MWLYFASIYIGIYICFMTLVLADLATLHYYQQTFILENYVIYCLQYIEVNMQDRGFG